MAINKNNSDYQNKIILLGAGLVICLLVLSAYSNTLYAPFVLDDLHSFVKEQKVLGFTFDFVGFENLARSKFGILRLLPMLTFVLDVKWFGASLAAFHLTNIVIHLFASFALLFLLQSLTLFPGTDSALRPGADNNKNHSTILMVFIVGLWSLNPVQTNAVTYIVQRMTSIAALFYFLAFGCYLRGRFYHLKAGLSKKTLIFYALCLLGFFCAMMSKENTATMPVICLFAEWLIIKDNSFFVVVKKYRSFILSSALLLGAIVAYKFYHGWLLGGYAHRHFTLLERLLTQLRIVTSYCGILLLPLPQWLNLEHDVSLSTSLFSPFSTLFSLMFLLSILIFAWKVKEKNSLITFAILWFFVNLLIESTVIPLELKFEHRLYLPSAGFYLALVLVLRELYIFLYGRNFSVNSVKIFVSVAVIICSGLSYLTYSRNVVWGDTVSLYKDCISKAPNKARTHSNLATAWLKRDEYEKALREAEKAIALGVKGYEEYWVAACDVIVSLHNAGEDKEAIIRGEHLLNASPKEAKKNAYPAFLHNLSVIYLAAGDYQKAFNLSLNGYKLCYKNNLQNEGAAFVQLIIRTLTTGINQGYKFDPGMKLNSEYPDVAVDEKMAQIFFDLNNYELALKYSEKVLEKNPGSVVAGKLKLEVNRILAANIRQKKMGTLKEKYLYQAFASRFHFFMALAFALEKYNIHLDGFLRYCLQQAETLNNSSPDLYIVKSWYFYKSGDYDKALKIIDQGIKLKPDYAHLWVNRGIYALADRNGYAYSAFAKALTLYPDYPHRGKVLEMQSLAEKLKDKNDTEVVDY